MYIRREVEETIREVASSFPCIAIYGPRQVGKSTTANYIFGDTFKCVTLDDLEDKALAESNPKLFLQTYGWPLMIDEIQKVPSLLDEIKIVIDKQRLRWIESGEERRLMYVLTGSNRFELQQGISDSLAGRCGEIEMYSFSQMERIGHMGDAFTPDIDVLLQRESSNRIAEKTRIDVFNDIFEGGMPDVVSGVSKRDDYYRSYVKTYIEKDVRKLIQDSNETTFRNFISIVALRTARELHYEEISNAVGIDVRTCRKWISILETSGIVYILQPFMTNLSSRIIKAPKLYFMDTGLCAYLCRWPNAQILSDSALGGAFFETYVVSELVKNLSSHNKDPKESIFYYRDTTQKEIDIIFVQGNRIYPIEIKTSSSPKKPTKNFSVLDKYKLDVGPGLVIDTCDRIRPIDEKTYYYPVYRLGE